MTSGFSEGRWNFFLRCEATHPAFGYLIKQREEFVKLLLADWVIFVIMAASTPDRHTEPYRGCGNNTIHYVFSSVLFIDDSAFNGDPMVSVEAGCESFQIGGIG